MSKHFWKNGADRLASHRGALNLQFVKNSIYEVQYSETQ